MIMSLKGHSQGVVEPFMWTTATVSVLYDTKNKKFIPSFSVNAHPYTE